VDVNFGQPILVAIQLGEWAFTRSFFSRLDLAWDQLRANGGDFSLIRAAIRGSSLETVEMLLDRGIPVNAILNGSAPYSPSGHNNPDITSNPVPRTGEKHAIGWSILHEAAAKVNVEITQLLLKRGADILATERYGTTVLHAAIAGKNPSVVTLLIDNEISILNTENHRRLSALGKAWISGHPETIDCHMNSGACLGRNFHVHILIDILELLERTEHATDATVWYNVNPGELGR
jgi:ankyrin repeat protein